MSSSCRFFTAAEATRQIHEYARELEDVDSDTEHEASCGEKLDLPPCNHVTMTTILH